MIPRAKYRAIGHRAWTSYGRVEWRTVHVRSPGDRFAVQVTQNVSRDEARRILAALAEQAKGRATCSMCDDPMTCGSCEWALRLQDEVTT